LEHLGVEITLTAIVHIRWGHGCHLLLKLGLCALLLLVYNIAWDEVPASLLLLDGLGLLGCCLVFGAILFQDVIHLLC